MKIKSLTGAPLFGAQFGPTSGQSLTMSGALVLSGLPVNPLQTATKSYVDTGVTVIPAEKLTSGTLSVLRLPAFTGDVLKTSGSGATVLANNGVPANTYAKYDVDAKGRVGVGYSLVANDIPALSWSKITTGKPTTDDGYGITDALSKSGDALTNFLSLTNNPTANLHAANKVYADTRINSNPKYATGDIMVRPSATTPSGFLRANGGVLTKASYSALYAAVGDSNNVLSQPGNGRPWHQQYEINSTQNKSITWAFHSSMTYYPGTRTGVVLKDKVYLTNVNNTTTMGYSNTIDAAGAISTTWSGSGILPMPAGTRLNCVHLVVKNRLFVIGGYDNAGTYLTDVYSAPINADGTIGAWSLQSALPEGLQQAHAVYTNNRIYVLGGYGNTGARSIVYTAVVNADGSLGAWSLGNAMPVAMYQFSTAVVKNRLYLLAGYAAGNSNAVYWAAINTDGSLGGWNTGTSLPVGSQGSEVFVTKNKLYFFVGNAGSGTSAVVYSSVINADGSLGTWVLDTALSTPLQGFFTFATSTKIYLVGYNGSSYSCISGTFTGSPNDYAPYYDGSITPTASTQFKLPDYSSKEVNGLNYFVKT